MYGVLSMCRQHGEPGLQSTQCINWCDTGSSGGIGGQSGSFGSYIRERGSMSMRNSPGCAAHRHRLVVDDAVHFVVGLLAVECARAAAGRDEC